MAFLKTSQPLVLSLFIRTTYGEDVILLSKDRGELKTGLPSVIKTAYRTGQNVPLSTLPGSPFTNLAHA